MKIIIMLALLFSHTSHSSFLSWDNIVKSMKIYEFTDGRRGYAMMQGLQVNCFNDEVSVQFRLDGFRGDMEQKLKVQVRFDNNDSYYVSAELWHPRLGGFLDENEQKFFK